MINLFLKLKEEFYSRYDAKARVKVFTEVLELIQPGDSMYSRRESGIYSTPYTCIALSRVLGARAITYNEYSFRRRTLIYWHNKHRYKSWWNQWDDISVEAKRQALIEEIIRK